MSCTNSPATSAPRSLIPERTALGLGKRRQICAVPRDSLQPTGRKGKTINSRKEPPNGYPSAKVLMSPWRLVGCLSSNQSWLYPDKSLGFLRQTSIELWEQDLFCPPFPTHLQMGGKHILYTIPLNCILGNVTQIEGRGLRKPAKGCF